MAIDTRSDAAPFLREPPSPLLADYVQLVLLIVLFSVGAPINLVSFTKLWRRKALRSTCRLAMLKLHLNIADLMILFIYVTSAACWQITFQWRGGDVLCKCIKFLHSTSFQLSSNIMVAVALDRLVTVVHCNLAGFRSSKRFQSLKSIRNSRQGSKKQTSDALALRYVRIFVYTAWIAAIVLNLPQFAIWRVYAPFEHRPNWRQCVTVWAIPAHRRYDWTMIANGTNATAAAPLVISQFTYDVLQLTFVFWTPAILLIISYVIIVLCLQRVCVKDQQKAVPKKQSEHSLKSITGSTSRNAPTTHRDERNPKRLPATYETAVAVSGEPTRA